MSYVRGVGDAFGLQIFGRLFAAEPYVLSVVGTERANALYSFDLRVALDGRDDVLADDSLLELRATLQLPLGGGRQPRIVHGVVLEVAAEAGAYRDRRIVRLRIGPRLALLKERRYSRVFTEKSALEVVTSLLAEHRVAYRLRITSPQTTRRYIVQYAESDYAFVRRLLAEIGVFFFFDHPTIEGATDGTNMGGGTEVVVLGDTAQSYSPVEALGAMQVTGDSGALLSADHHVFQFVARRRVRAAATVERAYDFYRPTIDLRSVAQATGSPHLAYAYGGEGDEGAPELVAAQTRLEQERRDAFVAEGQSGCRRLMPGRVVQIEGHDVLSLAGAYAISEVHHTAYAPDATPPGAPRYINRFSCVPASTPLRPKRRRRPEPHGTETAVVVGPKDKEIHTDAFGRVQVQFHWDLAGRMDGSTSTWLRVEQAWAGAGWGAQVLPRVGMEVVVTFLGGDVDRPLITGSVYNVTHPLPFPQPAELTKTGLRSSTSPGAEGFHEISIDDAKGAELLFVRAQRDQRRVVGHDDEERVVNDQRSVIGHDRVTKVGERDLLDVGQEHVVSVGGKTQPAGGGGGGGAQGTFTMSGKNASLDVKGDISMHAGGNVGIAADGTATISAPTVNIEAGDANIDAKGAVTITAGGPVTIKGANVIVIGGTITQN